MRVILANWSTLLVSVALVLSNTISVVANDDYTFNQLGQDLEGEAQWDNSGYSVALSNDGLTVAVGAHGNDGNGWSSGHVRVYKFDAGSWVQVGHDIDGENVYDYSGFDIDLSSDGTIVAIGAYCNDDGASCGGHVRVFKYNGNSWEQMGDDLDGDDAYKYFGRSLSLSADGQVVASSGRDYIQVHKYDAGTGWTMLGQEIARANSYSTSMVSLSHDGLVLAVGEENLNRVRVFEYDGSGWISMGQITGGNRFGYAVSLSNDGTILAVGAYGDSSYKGSVSVFEYNGATWNALGSPLHGDDLSEYFGYALELSSSGDRIVVGAYNSCIGAGRVALYEYDGDGSWVQKGEDLFGEAPFDYAGRAVAISGDGTILASGAYGHDGINGTDSGQVRVYESVPGTPPVPQVATYDYAFDQLGQDIDGEAPWDYSGYSLGISNDGKTIAIGAHANDGNGGSSGQARVYTYDDGLWVQKGKDIDGENAYDNAGYDVDLSSDGQIVAIGAIYNDDGANNGGHVRVLQYIGGTWEQMGDDLDGDDAYRYFGRSIALSEDGMVLASSGSTYVQVHKYDGSAWNVLGQEIPRNWGYSRSMVSLSGDGSVLAVGEYGSYDQVRVFEYDAGTGWSPLGQTITGPGYNFGFSVSLSSDGTTLGVGNHYNSTGHGNVHVFRYDGNMWNPLGSPLHGNQIYDYFGLDLEISSDGKKIAVGSYGQHGNCSRYIGKVGLYQYDDGDGAWFQVGPDIFGEAQYDNSGIAVALSGDGSIIASGSPWNHGINGSYSGHVRVYEVRRSGGASGDPHFKTWSGESYDFHGLCDLVLLKNQEFNKGLGMDIHIRTKKMKQWSFISNAVLRIGEDMLEIRGDPNGKTVTYWINGIKGNENELTNNAVLPYGVSGFPIFYRRTNSKQHEFTVDLGNDETIAIKTWKDLVRVDIHGATETNFGESLGLMGSFGKGLHVGRDETTVLTDFNDFGQEWQVLPSEPTLFHSREGPQAPEKCVVPTSTKLRRRLSENIVSHQQAAIACAGVDEGHRGMCIFDVMATNDMEIIRAY